MLVIVFTVWQTGSYHNHYTKLAQHHVWWWSAHLQTLTESDPFGTKWCDKSLTLNTVNTNTSMWSGWAWKSPHNLPRVQFRVIFLNGLQIGPFWVGVSPCYINTTINDHRPTLHPPLLHHWYWSPFVSLYVVAVRDSRLSAHQIQLVVERHWTQPVL